MDTALQLRMFYETKTPLTDKKILTLLENSLLVKKLTAPIELQPLSAIFLLSGLSEIPYAEKLPFIQQVISYCEKHVATDVGFSYTGKKEDIVPCYNALMLESYARLGLSHSASAQTALQWIKDCQLFQRNQETSWPYKGIRKHGGCLNQTPCYIGIGKTLRALLTYQEQSAEKDTEADKCIAQGVAYMLEHQMYLRKSAPRPISPHITDSVFPQYYALTLTDLVYILGKSKQTRHPNATALLALLKEKEVQEGRWKLDYSYKYKGYYSFETRRQPSEWLSYLYSFWLKE